MGGVIKDILKDFALRPEEFMFFLGAGFSKEIGLPSEQELAESLAKKYGKEKIQGALDDVIESLLKKGVNRKKICEAIKEEFNKSELPRNEYNFLGIFFRIINQVVQKLERKNSPHQVIIATTNWDETLTKIFGRKVLSIYSRNQVSKSREMTSRRIIVYHLHGSIEDCNSMILTKEDKNRVSEDTVMWQSFMADVNKHRVIFIGCSTADEDILGIYMKSRKGATINEKKDYIIVSDEGSKRRIEDMLAKNGLDGIANVVVMDSFEFLKELARSMGLVIERLKVELDTEKKMMEKLKEKGSVIIVGPRLSGLTTLYQNYFIELPEQKLCLEYDEYSEDSKKSFTDLMDNLEKEKIVLIAPEYLYEKYFEEYKSRIKDKDRLKNVDKLVKEITIKHMVSREEAEKYLEELIRTVHEDYKDKFDNELKNKILDLVKQEEENYPLKLLRDVFQDVNVRMRYESKEDIKRTLDEKINMRRDVEKILGVSVLLKNFVPSVISVFGEMLASLSPVLLVVGILTGELVKSIKDISEEKAKKNPFDKIIVLKKYWDSLNESERKMLCYKLDSSQHLRPGESEKYLRSVFGDELRDLEKKVEEAKTYVQKNLEEFQKKLEEFEKENKDILSKLAELNEGIKEFNNEFKSALDELRKSVEELRERIDKLKEELHANVVIADKKDFEKGFSNIKVENGKLRISVRPREFKDVVMIGEFGRLIDDVADTLKELGVVVVTGPKGIGKSILGTTVVWKLLNSGSAKWVIGVEDLSNDKIVVNFNNFLLNVKELGHRSLVVFDPSATYAYMEVSGKRHVLKNIKTTLENLFISIKPGEQEMLLIILPTEMYKPVDQLVRKELGGSVKDLDKVIKEIRLNDKEFLAGVIREYLGECQIGDEKLSELVDKVADFDSGYTLIARLVGEELARNCNIDKINELIDKSRGKAEEFILGHINSFFDVVDDNRARALVEIFALRRPFVDIQNAGSPILTRGIVEIIRRANDPKQMSPEMINWLVYRQHDLIEDTIKRLLDGEKFGEVSEPWRSISTNMPKITNDYEAVEYFINKYDKKFLEELSQFSNCWKRAALIIGHALIWNPKLPKEKYSDSTIVDVLNYCDIDDYLLVDNEIPYFVEMLVTYLYTTYLYTNGSSPFTRIFANEYENAIEEAKKLLEIWRKRGESYDFEVRYALGLALIVAEATRLGKAVNEDDAGMILKATLPAVLLTIHQYVKYILKALEPLRDKAPQQYLAMLVVALNQKPTDDTVMFIYDELKYILSNFFNKLMELVWPLMTAVQVCSNILRKRMHFTKEEVENIAKSMCDLLNALKKESNELAIIAEAYTLIPILEYSKYRDFISEYCSVNEPVTRADEVRKSLKELANKSDELLKNKYFMNWSTFVPWISQQDIRKLITDTEAVLTNSLAVYKFYNGELDEASKLFNETAEVFKSIGDWENYIVAHEWFLLAKVIKARSINEYVSLANDFEKLLIETLWNFEYTANYLEIASVVLNNYLVYLASIGRYDDTEKILSMYGVLLNYSEKVLVLTRLMLRLLGFTKVDEVKPEELIDTYKNEIIPFLPALKLALGIEASDAECPSKDFGYYILCIYAFLAVKGDSDALKTLKDSLDVDTLKLVQGLDGKALVQLLAPATSRCRLALMLYALVNGNIELAKKHAQWGSEKYRSVGRLFGDVYEACCDVSSEGFRLALLKLYYVHSANEAVL
jgi:polyhydroxyalkanoate synthesis regulator phasin